MFSHKGKTRTFAHNLKIASLLSFVAGGVNVAGFLSVQKLTTNVTGHFAFFIDEVFRQNYTLSLYYLLFILFFFLGSFTSNFLVELFTRINANVIYRVPVLMEAFILLGVAGLGEPLMKANPQFIAYALLFAMGLQNSLVTTLSKSVVRTTHLTGLFTDLGIELSNLFFYKQQEQRDALFSSIKLRLTIITFFFLGGLGSGLLYDTLGIQVLAISGLLLVSGLIYDDVVLKIRRMKK